MCLPRQRILEFYEGYVSIPLIPSSYASMLPHFDSLHAIHSPIFQMLPKIKMEVIEPVSVWDKIGERTTKKIRCYFKPPDQSFPVAVVLRDFHRNLPLECHLFWFPFPNNVIFVPFHRNVELRWQIYVEMHLHPDLTVDPNRMLYAPKKQKQKEGEREK